MKIFLLCCALCCASFVHAQSDPPELGSWQINNDFLTGYNGLAANVQEVRFSVNNAYINCYDIPTYTIGPWGNDPNVPSNQDFLFRIPRKPDVNSGTATPTPLGPEGVLTNGVVMFNAKDANSYNNQDVWHSNAVVVEATSFDACKGHPAPGGVYHHHQNPTCLYSADKSAHSPILGYAFDGFPIYGPYAYANTDGTGNIKRMSSSYRLRNITERTKLPNGDTLMGAQQGPAVSSQYPLGYYVEDYEYVPGLGDLDAHNGRTAKTPEYPQGTYAYYVTIDDSGNSVYPYIIGTTYYGNVAQDNISTQGKVTISESVAQFFPVGFVKDTLAPQFSPTFVCGTDSADYLTDYPPNNFRKGLGKLGSNKSGVGWLYGSGMDNTYNYDSTFLIDPAGYYVGMNSTRLRIHVTDISQDAHGALYVVDRLGNDTTYYFDYLADKLDGNPQQVNFLQTTFDPYTMPFSIRNTTNHDVLLLNIARKNIPQFTHDVSTVSFPLTMHAGDSLYIPITFTPDSYGKFHDTMTVYFRCLSELVAYINGTCSTSDVRENPLSGPGTVSLIGVAPNPVIARNSKSITVAYTLNSSKPTTVQVCNLLGQEMSRSNTALQGAGEWRQAVDISNLVAGTYAVRVTAGKFSDMKLLIVE